MLFGLSGHPEANARSQIVTPDDFRRLAADLLARADSLLPDWFPQGRRQGREFVCGNLAGEAGDSLKVNTDTGRWSDFATGESGGDMVSLYAAKERVSQAEAFRALGGRASAAAGPAGEPVIPVPDEWAACTCEHSRYGAPSVVWDYRDRLGRLIGRVARYDRKNGGKQVIPWTRYADGWHPKAFPRPRPLYGLEHLERAPDAPVVIVEGEKAADAARQILQGGPTYVVLTWPGGAQSWRTADWSPVHGRKDVILWPDADQPGIEAQWAIGNALIERCRRVRMIVPDGQPDKWDAADALAEGWDWPRFKEWAKPRLTPIDAVPDPAPASDRAPEPQNGTDPVQLELGAGPGGRVALWQKWRLDQNGNGDPLNTLTNATRVFENDPKLADICWYDEFMGRVLRGSAPRAREWTEPDDLEMTYYLQDQVGMKKVGREIVQQAVQLVAHRRVRNCVVDWLETLEWDREARIEHCFEDHLGAAPTVYTRAASRNFWISLVARAFQPGCKVDNMVVLEGAQGARKSSALEVIGGSWFAVQDEAVSGKGFLEVIQGKLLIEIAELDSFSRGDITAVKRVITTRSDRYRESYGRYAKDHPRRCVFVGTTNKDDWNRDETGARRFWPITCAAIDLDGLESARDQLFAEAVHRVREGETWWRMPVRATRNEQRARYEGDPWQDAIAHWVAQRLGQEVTVHEILDECLKIDAGKQDVWSQRRVAACLKSMGWRARKVREGRRVVRIWTEADEDEEDS